MNIEEQNERNNQLIEKERREQHERDGRKTRQARRANLWAIYGEVSSALKAWAGANVQCDSEAARALVPRVCEAFEKWKAAANSDPLSTK